MLKLEFVGINTCLDGAQNRGWNEHLAGDVVTKLGGVSARYMCPL